MEAVSLRKFRRENNFLERVVGKKAFWLVLASFLFVYPLARSLKRELPPPLPKLYKIPEFNLLNSFGKPYGSKDLKGRIYIANFMFTSCPTVCPKQMQKLQEIQKRIRGLNKKVRITTFSVHPEIDTPKVLYKYARKLQANPFVWSFLTGPKESLKTLITGGFKVPIEHSSQESTLFDIVHSEKFVLVDADGWVRGYYPTNKFSLNQMMVDVGLLANRS